jgi:hypothetical protein
MSTDNTQEPQAPQAITPEEPIESEMVEGESEVEKWKRFSRQWEAKAKASKAEADSNAEAARKFKEIEDSNKTELERAQAVIDELKDKVSTVFKDALVAKHGLDPESANVLLNASDEEGLTKQAEALAKAKERHPSNIGNTVNGLSDRTVEPTNSKESAWKHVFGL